MENQKDKKKKKVLMPFGLRNKLMAAISMLLVSSIMLVSSTYAWFTLSTAPEVKGISTSVGANGNLEMALLSTDSFKDLTKITSAVGDSSQTAGKTLATANLTWGNLVNLKYEEAGKTGNYYGLDQIKLMPARLNVTDAAKLTTDKLLSTPKYGNDGRVTELSNDTFSSSQRDTQGFVATTGAEAQTYGVRAVGESSTMTPQEKGLANAKSNYGLNLNAAKNEVSTALKDNMQNLANAMLGYTGSTGYKIQEEEKAAITALLDGIDKGLDKIDMAYGDVLRAYAANQIAEASKYETALKTVVVDEIKEGETVKTSAVTFENATYTQAIGKLTDLGFSVPTDANAFTTAVGKLTTMREAVVAARAKTTGESPDYKGAVQALVNPDGMTMMGLSMKKPTTDDEAADTVYKKDDHGNWVVDKDKLAGKAFGGALANGMELVMGEGSGLFADIAKVTGNYSASNKINVAYGDLTVTGAAVVMKTNVAQDTTVGTALQGIKANESVSGNTRYITDTYGYVIDLAVRTNAANSKLQLAKDGVQRVYTDATNTETMGGGSTMTFEAAKVDGAAVLQDVQVQRLMEAIRVVFFNPDTGDIYGYAIPGDFTVEGGKTTGKLVLQTATLENGKLSFTPKAGTEADDLMDLQQNTATKLSVLVYLDGDKVDNSMVANAAESITGSLNLQFKSSATLVPMQNSTLKQGKTTTGTQP